MGGSGGGGGTRRVMSLVLVVLRGPAGGTRSEEGEGKAKRANELHGELLVC